MIRYEDKNNVKLNDIVSYACVNAFANDNIYFKQVGEVEFVRAVCEDKMILPESDQLIIVWDEEKNDEISTITRFYDFKHRNSKPVCSIITVEYGVVSVPISTKCHMLKVSDPSFISTLYINSRYLNIFKTPKKDILQNTAYQQILSTSLKQIFNAIVNKK